MSTYEFLYNMDDKVFDHIQTTMVETGPDKLGLDIRAGYKFWVDEGTIVVGIVNDRILQYYGGFEYVDMNYRREYGDYVFYLDEDDRVRRHLDIYYSIERPEEDDEA